MLSKRSTVSAADPKALCEMVVLKYRVLQQSKQLYDRVAEDLLLSANLCRSIMRRLLAGAQTQAAGKTGTATRFLPSLLQS